MEEVNKADERSGELVLSAVTEGTGVVQSGEEEAEQRSHCFLQLPKRRL